MPGQGSSHPSNGLSRLPQRKGRHARAQTVCVFSVSFAL